MIDACVLRRAHATSEQKIRRLGSARAQLLASNDCGDSQDASQLYEASLAPTQEARDSTWLSVRDRHSQPRERVCVEGARSTNPDVAPRRGTRRRRAGVSEVLPTAVKYRLSTARARRVGSWMARSPHSLTRIPVITHESCHVKSETWTSRVSFLVSCVET